MLMIATHDCVCLNRVWSNPVSDIVVRLSNETQNKYHAMVVVDLKSCLFFVFCYHPVSLCREKPTMIALDLTQNEKLYPFERGRELDREQEITDAENE